MQNSERGTVRYKAPSFDGWSTPAELCAANNTCGDGFINMPAGSPYREPRGVTPAPPPIDGGFGTGGFPSSGELRFAAPPDNTARQNNTYNTRQNTFSANSNMGGANGSYTQNQNGLGGQNDTGGHGGGFAQGTANYQNDGQAAPGGQEDGGGSILGMLKDFLPGILGGMIGGKGLPDGGQLLEMLLNGGGKNDKSGGGGFNIASLLPLILGGGLGNIGGLFGGNKNSPQSKRTINLDDYRRIN